MAHNIAPHVLAAFASSKGMVIPSREDEPNAAKRLAAFESVKAAYLASLPVETEEKTPRKAHTPQEYTVSVMCSEDEKFESATVTVLGRGTGSEVLNPIMERAENAKALFEMDGLYVRILKLLSEEFAGWAPRKNAAKD